MKIFVLKALVAVPLIFGIAACFDGKNVKEVAPTTLDNATANYAANNFPAAKMQFELLAKGGDRVAQFYLATMYLNGQGVVTDKKLGIELLKSSAEQGFSFAQNDLGGFYIRGEVVGKDVDKAVKLWKLASAQGSVAAAESLAKLASIEKNDAGARVPGKKGSD